MLELFPESAAVEGGALSIGGVAVPRLAEEFGTPLVVYCEQTIRARRARTAAPRRTRWSSTGRRRSRTWRSSGCSPRRASGRTSRRSASSSSLSAPASRGERLVFHGNNKSDDELRAAAAGGRASSSSTRSTRSSARRRPGRRVLVRVTPGIEADTHAIDPDGPLGLEVRARRRTTRSRPCGLRSPPASTWRASTSTSARSSSDGGAALAAVELAGRLRRRCRDELGWTPRVVDLGGGLGIRVRRGRARAGDGRVRRATCAARLARGAGTDCRAALILEPGRSLVGRAGRHGVPRRRGEAGERRDDVRRGRRRHVGQPAPAAVRRALRRRCSRTAPTRPPPGVRGRGKHCESGDVLIDARRAARAAPRRPARSPGDRRIHARDGLELQRRAAPGGRAGRATARRG